VPLDSLTFLKFFFFFLNEAHPLRGILISQRKCKAFDPVIRNPADPTEKMNTPSFCRIPAVCDSENDWPIS
jgi:hypothetical protein